MAKLENGTWVLIADGEKALFLRNLTDGENPHLEVIREEHHENPPTRDQGTDRPGRLPDGGPNQRSAVQETDWHRLEQERFASELASILYRRAHAGDYERIVIAAAPHVLGELRHELHKEVVQRIVAEIPKTLTNHSIDKIERLVAQEIAGT